MTESNLPQDEILRRIDESTNGLAMMMASFIYVQFKKQPEALDTFLEIFDNTADRWAEMQGYTNAVDKFKMHLQYLRS